MRLADDVLARQAMVWCSDTLVLYHHETKRDSAVGVKSFNFNNIK